MAFSTALVLVTPETPSLGNLLSQLGFSSGAGSALAADILPLPPTSASGVVKDLGCGGSCYDGDGTCIHCGRTLNESSRLCKIEDGGCGKVWNQQCDDSNCKCKAVKA